MISDEPKEDREMEEEGGTSVRILFIPYSILESSSEDEAQDEDEIMNDDHQVTETLNADFEALPPDPTDIAQIENFLTQVCRGLDCLYPSISPF